MSSEFAQKEDLSKHAIVIYYSRFGNTKKVAESLSLGLAETGVHADCVEKDKVDIDSLEKYDLVCIGAPTEVFTASVAIKEFLKKLEKADLSGKLGFAFDTEASPGIFGSAARFIEKDLQKNLGLRIIVSHESARVKTTRHGGEITGATLRQGETAKFEEIGKWMGSLLNGVIALPPTIII